MGYSFFYRRPASVPKDSLFYSPDHIESVRASKTSLNNNIPERLSFDNIIDGNTCTPCTARDFMNYLIYVERSAENLQFYLWHKDYTNRFASLPQSDLVLSPEWTEKQRTLKARPGSKASKPLGITVNESMLKEGDLTPVQLSPNPFNTPPPSSCGDDKSISSSTAITSDPGPTSTTNSKLNAREVAAEAFENAARLQPFTIQPYREEIDRIITIYIKDGGSRQLNLSAKERDALIHALTNTTHPSAFKQITGTVEMFLRYQAHPNFIRWTVSNSNTPRNTAIRAMAVGGTICGLIVAILLTLSSAAPGWRAMSAILLSVGLTNAVANTRDTCMILHLRRHRLLHPWELFSDDGEEMKNFEPLSTNSNSYEDEPWLVKYEKRGFALRIFDAEVVVEEPALFRIQRRIVLESAIAGLLATAVIVVVFCFLPAGNFY